MREKNFEERLQELKERYDGSDFDLISILKLEDEYDEITEENPEHTKRRREILDMRHRMMCQLRPKGR